MQLEDTGEGNVVVLLHGSPSPLADFSRIRSTLARSYRVLAPIVPGYFGTPPVAPSELSFDAISRALVAELRARSIDRVAAIVGYSGGAYRALDLVLRHGLAADRIVALAPIAWMDDATRDAMRGAAAAVRADPSGDSVRPILPLRFLSETWRRTHPEDDARVSAWLDLVDPATLAAELEAQTEAPDLRPLLPGLTSQLYVRVGALDVACPPAWSETIVALAPHAQLSVVLDAGHALFVENEPATSQWVIESIVAPTTGTRARRS